LQLTKRELETVLFATELVDEFVTDSQRWSVVIDRRSRRTRGWCEHRAVGGTIGLSAFMLAHADDDEVFHTVTHEGAHAMCGRGESHGPRWQRAHRSLGGNGERYASAMPQAPKGKWRADCPNCGTVAWRWRLRADMRRAVHKCGETVRWIDVETGQLAV
jgi:hypothetical protein